MRVIFTLISAFFVFASFAQENQFSWSETKAQEEVYERAVAQAKAMQVCCGDFFTDKPICIQDLPENFVSGIIKKYPEGLTEETEQAEGVITTKYIYIVGGHLRLLEKKIYDWGGEFYYKNYMCPITAERFMEELSTLKAN